MINIRILTSLLIALLITVAPLAQKVKSETDPAADFSQYRTFRWVRIDTANLVRGSLPEGALSDDEADAQIRSSVERELIQKGFVKTSDKEADLLVNYFGVVSYRILDWEEFRTKRRSNVEGNTPLIPYEHWKPMSEAAEEGYAQREGNLTIDLVHADSNRLLWRGSMREAVLDRERRAKPEIQQQIDDAVAQILEALPARSRQ